MLLAALLAGLATAAPKADAARAKAVTSSAKKSGKLSRKAQRACRARFSRQRCARLARKRQARLRRARARARATSRDRIAPSVSVAAPAAGGTVSGSLSGSDCQATANDNVGVKRVKISVDGTTIASDGKAPYTCAWNTAGSGDGVHTVKATAYDFAGNSASTSVLVTVDNTPDPAPAPAPEPAPAPTTEPAPAPTTETAPAPQPSESTVEVPPLVSLSITGKTYYVSPSGSDASAGTSPTAPWRTVNKVNNASLQPGDGVLFQAGATFSDATLMPPTSGSGSARIVFGSYGTGRATLTKGVWMSSQAWLGFKDLAITGPAQGIVASAGGTGVDEVVVQNVAIASVGIGVNSASSANDNWTIQASTIDGTGDSGIILQGKGHVVSANSILNTGTDTSISYGKHGIYLKAADSRVVANTIRNFQANGVSVRYRNSRVEGNVIAGGPIGIAWFQNDSVAGTSYWNANNISGTTAACIYVSESDSAGATKESFVIVGNTLSKQSGTYMNLKPTTGTYTVEGNVQQ